MARYAKFFSVGAGGGTNNLQLPLGTILDTTLRQVQDGTGTGSPLYLSTGGLRVGTTAGSAMYWDDVNNRLGVGTTTPIGILHLKSTAATTRMVMDGDAGQSKIITYRTAGLQRFGLYVNNTAESGSNAGSDFAVRAYSDAGTLLTTPVFIKRSTGNVGINTLTGTAKLQVVGSGNSSATTSLLVQNSGGTTALQVLDNLNTTFGGTVQAQGFLYAGVSELSGNCRVTTTNPANPTARLFSSEGSASQTISPTTSFHDIRNFTPTSGSALYTAFQWSGTINQTGSANGIVRGLFINPTVTAAADFRAIEVSNGGAYINTTSVQASAILQADSTTKGFLPPRMTTTQKNAIASPAAGLVVYDTTNNGVAYYDGTTWGYLSGAKQNLTGSGGTLNIGFRNGNIVDLALNASTTLTFGSHVVGTYIIEVTQGGGGSNTLTYPASVKWSGGTPPTLTTAVGKTDILTFFHDGTFFYGTYSLNY